MNEPIIAEPRPTRDSSLAMTALRELLGPDPPEGVLLELLQRSNMDVNAAADSFLGGHTEGVPRIAKQPSRTDEVGRLPKGWLVEVVDGVNVFVNEQSGDRTKERPYDRCGTNGCILLDRHSCMHVFAEFEPSARRAGRGGGAAPRPKAAPRVRTSADAAASLERCIICMQVWDARGETSRAAASFGCCCGGWFHHACMWTWYRDRTSPKKFGELGRLSRSFPGVVLCPSCRTPVTVRRPGPRQ